MASTATLFSAVLALLSTARAAPVEKRQVQSCNTLSPVLDVSAPMQLFAVPRTAVTDNSGCSVTQQITSGPVTWLSIQQPDGPATDGQRYLFSGATYPSDPKFTLTGGYIESVLPIPKADPPANITWSSVNDVLFPIGSAAGGAVSFTTENEGADGGLAISPVNGAVYLDKESSPDLQPSYAIWKLCSGSTINPNGSYLAFNGTDSAACDDVYLVGCNNGYCPSS